MEGTATGIAKSSRLNDLSGKEWLPATRSVFVDGVNDARNSLSWGSLEAGSVAVMSLPEARESNKKLHPATFPESDARRLIRMFTREGGNVVDPFIGSGSTALACIAENRFCIGFELYEKWVRLAWERIADFISGSASHVEFQDKVDIRIGDSLEGASILPTESQDFVLTSPPYWAILSKKDHKAERERTNNGLDTDYGNDPNDLSQIVSYEGFLNALGDHFEQWYRFLRPRGYAAVVVSDFRHGQRYYPFHAHVSMRLEESGFTTQGLIIIVQDNKRLYPYGYPTTYVPNICNQFVIIGRKL